MLSTCVLSMVYLVAHFSRLGALCRRFAGVLSSVSKHSEVVMCLMEKVGVLDQLHSGMSYRAAGDESVAGHSTV